MLSLKTLRASGMTALLVAASATAASAADMLGAPPPPPVPMAAPVMGGDSGFYLRGDVGVGVNTASNIIYTPVLPTERTLRHSVDPTAFLGVGVGYQANSWLRGDITGEYRLRSSYSLHERIENATTPANYYLNYGKGRIATMVGLANVYVDLGTWNRITPFVGVGVGLASHHTSGQEDFGYGPGNPGGHGSGGSKTKNNLAWAVHAGLSYDVGNNWKLEGGYRYLNMGKVNTGTIHCDIACAPYHTQIKNYASHDVKFGVRYLFADAAPAMTYAPGPLVRKY